MMDEAIMMTVSEVLNGNVWDEISSGFLSAGLFLDIFSYFQAHNTFMMAMK